MTEYCSSCGNPRNPIYEKCPFCGSVYEERRPAPTPPPAPMNQNYVPQNQNYTPQNYNVLNTQPKANSQQNCCGAIFGLIILVFIFWFILT